MFIDFSEKNMQFHMGCDSFSYIMKVSPEGKLINLHYGSPLPRRDFDYMSTGPSRGFSLQKDSGLSYGNIAFEYETFGVFTLKKGPLVMLIGESVSTDFRYDSHKVISGKEKSTDQPMTRASEDEAMTLIISLKEIRADIYLELHYTIFDKGIISRRVKVINSSNEKAVIKRFDSASFSFGSGDYDLITYPGSWIKEFNETRRSLDTGTIEAGSMTGVSTASCQPYAIIADRQATEDYGEAYGAALIYAGNFNIRATKDIFGINELSLGISDFDFDWELENGMQIESPEVLSVYSSNGFGDMSRRFHDIFLNNLMPENMHMTSKVIVNSWEGMYFDISEEKLMTLAKESKKLGAEELIIDDGWFENRNDDTSGLGRWKVDEGKFPSGFKKLSGEIDLGIWIEPEMTSYHTDKIIGTDGLSPTRSRNQYVLDLSDEKVVLDIFKKIDEVLKTGDFKSIKWDANRPITEITRGRKFHEYTLGLYKLFDMVKTAYPEISIESCSAGGGRANAAMLAYAPSTWLSDNTDAFERLRMLHAASKFLPLRSIGSHVTASPNHQMLTEVSLDTRANVAYFGTFGYEMDLGKINHSAKEAVKKQIEFFKENRKLIQTGEFYRLSSMGLICHMVVSDDKSKAIVGIYEKNMKPNAGVRKVKLTGLESDSIYLIEGSEFTGAELMDYGYMLTEFFTGVQTVSELEPGKPGFGDNASRILIVEKKVTL